MNRLNGRQIVVGCPVPCDCYDGRGNLLLKKGLIVGSQRQVDFLLERGLFGQESPDAAQSALDGKPPTPFRILTEFNDRLKHLFTLLGQESDAAESELSAISFPDRILGLAEDVQKLCNFDADAALGSVHLDSSGHYAVVHPLYRAVLCELVALRKKIAAEERRSIIAAALTCDLSMLKLQDELFGHQGGLSDSQKQKIAAHPRETVEILESFGVVNSVWTTAVLQHHERLNGKGYPAGLQADEISVWARVLRLADMYTAMMTPRLYRKPATSKLAMREIFLKRGVEIDEELAVLIVKELGVYPPGAFVKLKNGETGIVIKRGANPKAPLVKSVVGPRGAPLERPMSRVTGSPEFEIVDVVDRDPIVKIDLHKLWGYDA